ncbi:MAG: SAM-dependent methyltransferase [Candidatus Hodarchaeota archaeon]
MWKYYEICLKRHFLCNPFNKEKFEKLCKLLRLKRGARVLDIGCGKGEFLIRLAELYDISGVGVDLSPYFVKDFLEKYQKLIPKSDIKILEMDGADYKPESPESFDLTMCIGASWIYNGYRGTIQALKKMTKPGGLILVGQPFWLKEPSEEHLKAEELKREEIGSHQDTVKVGEEEGLTCLYTMVGNHDDWDHYETLQWWAVEDYIRANPDDEDIPELLELKRREKEIYLKWGRETIGWAMYVFRKP